MTGDELLACPFCGSADIDIALPDTPIDGDVFCLDCGGSAPRERWNTRAHLKGEVRGDAIEQIRHLGNEYADGMTNGIQWLRNIRDGISTVDEALAEMESNLVRIRNLPTQPPSPRVEDEAESLKNTIRSAFDMLYEYKNDMQNATHAKRLLRNAIASFDGPELLLSREASMEKHLATPPQDLDIRGGG